MELYGYLAHEKPASKFKIGWRIGCLPFISHWIDPDSIALNKNQFLKRRN
jgi:hypothetical protein